MNAEVLRLQQSLAAEGFDPGPIDGIMGPKTRAALAASAKAAAARLTFGEVGVLSAQHRKARTKLPTAIVIHDTVSHTASAAQRTLDAEGYATHFFVDLDGSVYQCMDPGSEYGAHCAGINEASIGIDVVAILDPTLATDRERERMVERPWSASRIRGRVIDYAEDQKLALPKLCRSLCDAYDIPHYVLDAACTYGTKVPGLSADFRGILSHSSWSSRRWDGMLGVEALLAAGGWEHDAGAWTGPRVQGAVP